VTGAAATAAPAGNTAPPAIEIVHVVAVAENGVIGQGGTMPWRLKSDLRRFRALTVGKPVLMGRKTYLAVGRPLPERTNIVVSRDPAFAAPGLVVAPSLEFALQIARGDALRRGADAIMVIGGGDIYAQTMDLADRLEVTIVHAAPPGDAWFPPIDPARWREIFREHHAAGADDSADFSYLTYRRAPVRPT